MRDCVIMGGSSHPELVEEICNMLDVEPAPLESRIFSNGETGVNIQESVRDKDVFVVQTSYDNANDFLMELLILVSAVKIASAKSVTAVLPYFPYSRQVDASSATKKATNFSHHHPLHQPKLPNEMLQTNSLKIPGKTFGEGAESSPGIEIENSPRKASTFGASGAVSTPRKHKHAVFAERSSTPSTSMTDPDMDLIADTRSWVAQAGPLVASLLATAGADHVITMDLHDPQYQGFFDVPFDNLLFRPLLIEYIQAIVPAYHSAVIVSPDAGGAKRATQVADQLHTRFALIHQDRRNNAEILVGDVNDRVAILVDDLVDTGKTVMRAARILKDHGAVKVFAVCTHGIFSGDTIYRIRDSAIDRMVTTNSTPQTKHREVLGDRLDVVDISLLFAESIRRVYNGESISRLYKQVPLAI